MRFRLSTLKLSKTIELSRCDVRCTLWACYKHTRMRYFRLSFSLWCVFDRFWPSTLIRYECFFVLIHFQERLQIDAVSMKTHGVLVWTEGLNESKCNVCNPSVVPIFETIFDRASFANWLPCPFLTLFHNEETWHGKTAVQKQSNQPMNRMGRT